MVQRIQLRRGTAAAAAANNVVLAEGEVGYETDTGEWKIGDGTTAWADLDYQPSPADLAAVLASLEDKVDVLDLDTQVTALAADPGSDLAAFHSATYARNNAPLFSGLAEMEHIEAGQYRPVGIHPTDSALLGWYFAGGAFVRSTDDGSAWATWNTPHADMIPRGVRDLRFLDNGEAIAVVQAGSGVGESLWLSSGLATPATATWTNALELASGLSFSYGGVSVHGSTVLASEYGPQTNSGAPATARRVYLSTDSGATFTEVFDLNTTTVVGEAGPYGSGTTSQHPHGCAVDPYWSRLWVAIGDAGASGTCATIYSDDSGATWELYPGTKSSVGTKQNVIPNALPNAVVFGSDFTPSGVRAIERDRYRQGGEFRHAHTIDEGLGIQFLGRHAYRVGDGPLLMSFTGVLNESPGVLVATWDGETFVNLYRDTNRIDGGANYAGLERAYGPTNTGKVVAYLNDTTRYPSGSILRGFLPSRPVRPNKRAAVQGLLRSGYYYAPPLGTTPLTYSQGVMRATPLHLAESVVLDRIGLQIQAAGEAGSVVRLGVYADDNGAPGELIVDAGTIDGASATYQELPIERQVGPGFIWLAAVAQDCPSTPPTVWGNTYDGVMPVGSTSPGLIAANGLCGYEGPSTTGALPAAFTISGGASGAQRVIVRVA